MILFSADPQELRDFLEAKCQQFLGPREIDQICAAFHVARAAWQAENEGERGTGRGQVEPEQT